MSDTIFALATAPGRAAIAVVRLSGPGAGDALQALAGSLPSARRAAVRVLRTAHGEQLDQAVAIWMPAPASYTGEDSVELHLHGGPAVVAAVTQALVDIGLRLAEPGEFTRRAFENDRLDLAQAEAVADLIDAETDSQRGQALKQLDGALSHRYAGWRSILVEALAFLEAAVDFPDEDLPEALADQIRPQLKSLEVDLRLALADAARGERVREGFRVALVGAPNAGKSSLLNRLLGRDAAIVTAIPGTTRDIIEATVVIEGFKVFLADTAGVREAVDEIEVEGVRRARAWAEAADLRLWVVDRSAGAAAWAQAASLIRPGDLLVLNKSDEPVGADEAAATAAARTAGVEVRFATACADTGISAVRDFLSATVCDRLTGSEFPAATRLRHRARLEEALGHLLRAEDALSLGAELAAEDLRLAARALERVSGRIDTESVLDVVFGSFCIGK